MDELDCSDNELATFVDKTIALRRHPTQEDVNATTNTGIVRHKIIGNVMTVSLKVEQKMLIT